MAEDKTQAEEKLQKLSDRVHREWAKLHAVTEKQMVAVREAVRDRWIYEQEHRQATDAGKPQNRSQTATQQQSEAERHRHQQDHSHGHSH